MLSKPPTNQTTCEVRNTTMTALHNIHQRQRSQTYTRVYMVPEATKGKWTGPNVEVKCKIDSGTSANVMPISVFNRLCLAMFDSTWKALERFKSDWTSLTAFGGDTIKQLGIRAMKGIWKNEKWKFIFHSVDAHGQVVLGLGILKQMGIFTQHSMVCIETIDLYSK